MLLLNNLSYIITHLHVFFQKINKKGVVNVTKYSNFATANYMFNFFEYKKRSNNGKHQCFRGKGLSISAAENNALTYNFGDRFVVFFSQILLVNISLTKDFSKSFFLFCVNPLICANVYSLLLIPENKKKVLFVYNRNNPK